MVCGVQGCMSTALSRDRRTWLRAWLAVTTLTILSLLASKAWASEDPPGRVGRLADMQGGVSLYDQERGDWSEAERNRPVTTGDRLSTAPGGRVELRVGSTVLRLGPSSELEVMRLDDERLVFQLRTGTLAVRVRSREKADEIDIVTGEARLLPVRAGHYRIDRLDDVTHAGAWRGALRIDDAGGFVIETGQRAELWREGRDGRERRNLRFAWSTLPADAFSDWVARDDARDDRRASNNHVSPEMTGSEDLDRHGRWDRHPEHGVIWYPSSVTVGWAPYRYGRWAYVRPWGWTWVDDAPWGFAPFHYGRWVSWGGRWGWCPGEYVARPVYAPALVAWVGRPGVSVSVNIGGPHIGWVPLAPREWYQPHYRHTPVYIDRVNPRVPGIGPRPPERQVPTGPIMYTNQGVPGGVTVVSRDVLQQRQPVARAVVDAAPVANAPQQGGWVQAQPPQREVRDLRNLREGQPRVGGQQPAPVTVQPAPQPNPAGVIDLRRERQVERPPERPVQSSPAPQPGAQGMPAPVTVQPAPQPGALPVGRDGRDGRDSRERQDRGDRDSERRRDAWVQNPRPVQAAPAAPVAAPPPQAAPVPVRPAPQAAPPAPAPAIPVVRQREGPPPARVVQPPQPPQPAKGDKEERKRMPEIQRGGQDTR